MFVFKWLHLDKVDLLRSRRARAASLSAPRGAGRELLSDARAAGARLRDHGRAALPNAEVRAGPRQGVHARGGRGPGHPPAATPRRAAARRRPAPPGAAEHGGAGSRRGGAVLCHIDHPGRRKGHVAARCAAHSGRCAAAEANSRCRGLYRSRQPQDDGTGDGDHRRADGGHPGAGPGQCGLVAKRCWRRSDGGDHEAPLSDLRAAGVACAVRLRAAHYSACGSADRSAPAPG